MVRKARKEPPIGSLPPRKRGPEYISLNDAVKRYMKATGRTRRQAEAALLQALKSGKVEARGIAVGEEDLGPQTIPVEVFQSIPSEH